MSKRFSVLIHSEGKRYLERDIDADSVERMIRILEERLSRRLVDVHFYNPYSNDYQPLTANDFDVIPRNLELQATLTSWPVKTTPQQQQGRPGVRGVVDQHVDHLPPPNAGAGRHAERSVSGGAAGRSGTQSRGRSHSALAEDPGIRNVVETGQPPQVYCPYCRNPHSKFCSMTGKAHSDLGATSEFRDGTQTTTFKARTVEHIRSLALPLFNVGRLTKEELIACCADVSDEFFHRRGVEDPEQHSYRREPSLQERDLLRVMVKAYNADQYGSVRDEGGKGRARSAKKRGEPTPDSQTPRGRMRGVSGAAGAPIQGRIDADGGWQMHNKKGPWPGVRGRMDGGGGGYHVRNRQRSPPTHTRETYYSRDRKRRPATYSPPIPPELDEDCDVEEDGRARGGAGGMDFSMGDNNPGNYGKGNNYGAQSTPNTSPPRSPFRVGGGGDGGPGRSASPTNETSVFSSVSYTVAGTFPHMSGQTPDRIGDNQLRVNLQPPTVGDPDQDVVIVGSLQSFSPVSLCWWLSYGPQKLVLNLDRMYSSHFVTTYQISENAFVLTFRAGALVPGWQYHVHVTVTSSRGTTSEGQTTFLVPAHGGEKSPVPAIGSRSNVNEMVHGGRGGMVGMQQETVGMMTSPIKRYGQGYHGDHEGGWISKTGEETPPPVIGSGIGNLAQHNANRSSSPSALKKAMMPPGIASAMGAGSNGAGGLVGSPAGGADGSGSTPGADGMTQSIPVGDMISAHGGGAGGQGGYHDQLKHFFMTQIEPLYFLSPNPSMTEQQFRAIIKEVAKKYWLKHTEDTLLSDDIKKDVVLDVKAEIGKARTVVDATPAKSVYRSIM